MTVKLLIFQSSRLTFPNAEFKGDFLFTHPETVAPRSVRISTFRRYQLVILKNVIVKAL